MTQARKLSYDEIETLVDQCSADEKLRLVRRLERATFGGRFDQLLDRLRDQAEPLTPKDIDVEVQVVREQRYATP